MKERNIFDFMPSDNIKMKILVACEESQEVTKAFRAKGHEAYSCDTEPCSGGHPEWHLQQNVIPLLKQEWDMIIAFPPCTYLTVAGNRWFNIEKYGEKAIKRLKDKEKAVEFFMQFANADCAKIVIENPIGAMSTRYKKPNQIVHPYHFGDKARKSTCLWIKGLPLLKHTDVVDMGKIASGGYSVGASANYVTDENGKILKWSDPRTAKIRSKTFPGIAQAMADQWG